MSLADTLVITSYPPAWQSLADITCATHKAYCDRWGYDYHADCSHLHDRYFDPILQREERLPVKGFVKLDLLLHFLPRYKTVCWLDGDLAITNHSIPIEQWLSLIRKPAEILVPFDFNTHNATVIIARSTDLVWEFFWACNNTGRKLFLKHDWVEMEAMRYFSERPPYDKILAYESIKLLCPILPQEYVPYVPLRMSQKYAWEPGAWSVHLSALPLERRVELAREYANNDSPSDILVQGSTPLAK
jgi:hypothetical protein